MIKVELPYDFGTFMKAKDFDGNVECRGSIVGYTVTDEGWLVWISAYKESFAGEYLPSMVEPMTEEEIEEMISEYE